MNFEPLLQILKEYGPVIAGVLALVADILIGSIVLFHSRIVKRAISKAIDRNEFTICPYCHEKIHLKDVVFRLPTGQIDQNLNGKPDDEE